MKTPKVRDVLLILFLANLVGCHGTPDGFTPVTWERFQRENPQEAKVLRWIQGSGERRRLRRRFVAILVAHGDSPEVAEQRFHVDAEQAMVRRLDLREYLVGGLRNLIQFREQRRQAALQRNAKGHGEPGFSPRDEMALWMDKALLAELLQE